MSTAGKRLVTVAILPGWTAPGAAALGVGLHLAAGHHGDHGIQHERELADLAGAATHGHHHDLGSAPDHDHDWTFDGQARATGAGPAFGAVLPAPALPPATLAEGSRFDGSSRLISLLAWLIAAAGGAQEPRVLTEADRADRHPRFLADSGG